MELLGDLLLAVLRELAALQERGHIVAEGKLLDLGEEGLERCGRVRQQLVKVGGGGVGGKRERVGLVGAGTELRRVDAVVEVENLREQDDAVEVYVLDDGAEHGGARGSV